MMHVMSAPPSAPPTAAPAGANSRSPDGGDFARLLATQARPASTESEPTTDDAPATLDGEGGDADAVIDASAHAAAPAQGVLPAIVAPPAVTADVVPAAEVHLPTDGEATNTAAPSTSAVTPASADGEVVTTTAAVPAAATEATSTTDTTSTQGPTPASSSQVPSAGTTGSAPAAPDVAAATEVASGDAADGAEGTPRAAHDTLLTTSGAQGRAGAEPARAVAGPSSVAPAGTGEVPTASVAGPTEETMDGARPGPAVGDRPATRMAASPQGQPDAGAVASAPDVDGAAPTTTRPAETGKPLPTAVLDRVMRAVEALENAPPPKRVSFEVDGLRLTVSLRGDEVNVAVRGGGDQLGSGWQRDLDGALRGRGLGLADGHGSDADRGEDGRRHPEQRAPHPSPRANPAFRRPAEAAADTSTDLQL